MKKFYLGLLISLFSTTIYGQTLFDFESAANSGATVTQTVSGITTTVSYSSGVADILPIGPPQNNVIWDGGSGMPPVVMTVSFSTPVNIQSIVLTEPMGMLGGEFILEPTGGANSAVMDMLVSENFNQYLGWTGITSFTVEYDIGLALAIDDILINCTASTGTDTKTECDSYTWIDGNTYTSSNNTATFNIVSGASNGCDSLVSLDLTILNSAAGTDTQIACDSYTWIDGNTYTSSNSTATFNVDGGGAAANGCDSISTLDLTIINSAVGTDVQAACDTYDWIDGNTYTSSNNTATFNVIGGASNGCDSLVTLDLTINSEGIDVQTACDTYDWIDGNTYTSGNNTATFNIVGGSVLGCDSLVTLDLTIVNSATGTETTTACNSYTWIDGNTYTSDNSSATFNIVGGASNGCDSLVSLDLTILNSATGTETTTECETYTWIDGNTYTSSNNSATFNIVGGASNGCDSLVTLDLTIINGATGTDTRTECNSYTWIDGNTYTSSNSTATFNVNGGGAAANGCDSISTLDLTIINSAVGTDVQAACDTYDWIDGNTYTSSNNTATFNVIGGASNGCDSLVTLDLTINSEGTDVQTACNTYDWIDGNTYTASNNTATFNIVGGSVLGCDSLVTLDLTIVNSATGTETTTECDSYTWIDGVTYTSDNSSATFNIVGGASNGCDSLVTLDLTILNSATGTETLTECDSYTWIDGVTYVADNNSATFNIVGGAANGCDSLVTLDLTIINSTSSVETVNACSNFTYWNSTLYSAAGTYSIILTNSVGCDSAATLVLTLDNASSGTDVITACNSYTWIDGVTYTSSNNNTVHFLPNAMGCDSAVALDLTIIYSTTGTDTQTACNTYDWIDGNTYTTDNNSATFNIVGGASNGCDSLVTLDLTIVNGATGIDVQTACFTYDWIDGNTYTSSNNSATYTFVGGAANGCDSIVTLDLTINTVNVTLSVSGSAISAITSGAVYQWLDCDDNNSEITGETSQSYTATLTGNYAVEVTENTCVDTSNCANMDFTGVNENYGNTFNIYPNPTSSEFTLYFGTNESDLDVTISNILGEIVYNNSGVSKSQLNINASEWETGVYMINITTKENVKTIKMIKE